MYPSIANPSRQERASSANAAHSHDRPPFGRWRGDRPTSLGENSASPPEMSSIGDESGFRGARVRRTLRRVPSSEGLSAASRPRGAPVIITVPNTLDEALDPAWLTAALGQRFPGVEVTAVTR